MALVPLPATVALSARRLVPLKTATLVVARPALRLEVGLPALRVGPLRLGRPRVPTRLTTRVPPWLVARLPSGLTTRLVTGLPSRVPGRLLRPARVLARLTAWLATRLSARPPRLVAWAPPTWLSRLVRAGAAVLLRRAVATPLTHRRPTSRAGPPLARRPCRGRIDSSRIG